jgi:hypothetical protein
MTRSTLHSALSVSLFIVACGGSESDIGRSGPYDGDASAGAGGSSAGASGSGGAGAGGAGNSGTGGSSTTNVFVDQLPSGPDGCLPRALSPFDGVCKIIEATTVPARSSCSEPGRSPVTSQAIIEGARSRLQASNLCGSPQAPVLDCSLFLFCEIVEANDSCLTTSPSPDAVGWCYIDPDNGIGDPSLVARCPATSRRIVRFVGADTPFAGAQLLIVCGSGF